MVAGRADDGSNCRWLWIEPPLSPRLEEALESENEPDDGEEYKPFSDNCAVTNHGDHSLVSFTKLRPITDIDLWNQVAATLEKAGAMVEPMQPGCYSAEDIEILEAFAATYRRGGLAPVVFL